MLAARRTVVVPLAQESTERRQPVRLIRTAAGTEEEPTPATASRRPLLSWHPVRPLLAVVLPDASLRFYRTRHGEVAATPTALTHEFMLGVECVQWAPLSEVVAVGCTHGVGLWRLLADAPGAAWMTFLQHPRGCPAHAIAWSPNGRLLATICREERFVVVWDVATRTSTALHLPHNELPRLLAWAPNDLYLLVTFEHDGFAMWETKRWTSESWRIEGQCRAVAWSPEGSRLALAIHNSRAPEDYPQPLFVGIIQEGTDVTTQFSVEFVTTVLPQPDLPMQHNNNTPAAPAPASSLVCGGNTVEHLSWNGRGDLLVAGFQQGTQGVLAAYQVHHAPTVTFAMTRVLAGPRHARLECVACCPDDRHGQVVGALWFNHTDVDGQGPDAADGEGPEGGDMLEVYMDGSDRSGVGVYASR